MYNLVPCDVMMEVRSSSLEPLILSPPSFLQRKQRKMVETNHNPLLEKRQHHLGALYLKILKSVLLITLGTTTPRNTTILSVTRHVFKLISLKWTPSFGSLQRFIYIYK